MPKTLAKSPFFIDKKGREAVAAYPLCHQPARNSELVAECARCGELAADPLSLVASGPCTEPKKASEPVDRRGMAISIAPAEPKRTWVAGSQPLHGDRIEPHYEMIGGFVAQGYIDADHIVKSDRRPTPIAALVDLTEKIEVAFTQNLLRFEEDGTIVPF